MMVEKDVIGDAGMNEGIAVKKVIALVCTLLLLCGCSQDDRLPCVHCNELVNRWIPLENGDVVCGKCFTEREYLVCLNCDTAFDPDGSDAGGLGYCDGCAQELVRYCESCGYPYLLEQMYEEDGLYICAMCECAELEAIIDEYLAQDELTIEARFERAYAEAQENDRMNVDSGE